MILSFGTDMLDQQCSPRSQSDQSVHCLPFHLHLLDNYTKVKTLFKF